MTGKEAMRFAMYSRNLLQQQVAELAGYKRQSNVSEILRSDNARIDKFVQILNACDYDLVMVDREDPGKMYTIDANIVGRGEAELQADAK